LFGVVADGKVELTPAGQFTHNTLIRIPERFPDIQLDEFIIMPDHVHAIIFTGSAPNLEDSANTVGFVLKSFKNVVTSAWRNGVSSGWPRYEERLWQRDYYDRIIRNDVELESIREYILANPARWSERQDH
jgi:REP element-mobilizing transposase RayT